MGITKKNHYRGNDFNNQELKDAKSLQLNQDATSSDEAVRKAQAETLSAQAAQDILVEASVNASSSTEPAAKSFLNNGGFFCIDCPLRKSDTAEYHLPIWPMQFSNSCPACTNFFTVLKAVVAAVTAVIGSSMMPLRSQRLCPDII